MKVLMLETRRGTEDGFTVKQYFKDEEYDLRDHLALAFLAAGFAVPIKEKAIQKPTKSKKKNAKQKAEEFFS